MPAPESRTEPIATDAPPIRPELELELVRRSVDGDMRAWGRLYQHYFDQLYRHICFLTGDPLASEDLVQESFARAQASLRRFEGRSRFSTWLHGVAINVVRKHWDSRTKQGATKDRLANASSVIPQAADLERQHLQRSRARALYRVVDLLPEHLRDAFILRDLQGLEVSEAAARLGITEANLRVRACRARARVHDLLVAEGWIEAPGGRR